MARVICKTPYKVQVLRGRKLVERSSFETEEQAWNHSSFLERRYYEELHDYNVRVTITYNKQFLKVA